MSSFRTFARHLFILILLVLPGMAFAVDLQRFEGEYIGSAEFEFDGNAERRDMSTMITAKGDGFELSWTSVTYKSDGRTKEKTYTIGFVPSERENIYQSAMKSNLFGKAVPLDPLRGEPFVWARFEGDTFSVFSLFINEVGEYEIQEFHRTLVAEGLQLRFQRVHNGVAEKEIQTLLIRQ